MGFYHTERFYPKPDLEQFSVTEEKCTEASRFSHCFLGSSLYRECDGESHYHLKIMRRRPDSQSRPSLCG